MAFNWQTFRTRTLTGVIFVLVMLAGLLWNQWSFLILFSVVHFGCWWEYLKLIEKIHHIFFHPYVKKCFFAWEEKAFLYFMLCYISLLILAISVDWSGRRRLLREQRVQVRPCKGLADRPRKASAWSGNQLCSDFNARLPILKLTHLS